MTLAVVVLAAGASRRLGEPKALARIGDRTALQHLALAARTLTGGPRTLVVTGAHHEEIAAHVEASALDVDVAHNPDWAQGRTGSVAVGAAARPGMDLVVAPIDAPLVPGEVFEALEREWKARGAPLAGWLAPATDGGSRYGHPVVLGRELARSAAALPPDTPLRHVRSGADSLFRVDVESLAIHDDLDEPTDLQALRRRVTER